MSDEGGAFRTTSSDGMPTRTASQERIAGDALKARMTVADLALRCEWEDDEERNEAVRDVLEALGLLP